MPEAELNTPRTFWFLPTPLDLGLDEDLELSVYDDAGVAISGSPFPARLVVSPLEIGTVGVYGAGPVSFPAVGAYSLVWTCQAPAIKAVEQVSVTDEPLGDFPTGVSRKHRAQTPGFAAVADLVLRVIKDGVKIGATRSTAVTGISGVYETVDPFLLADPGTYLFLWTSATGGHTYTRAETWLVLSSPSERTISVVVVDPVPIPEVPQTSTDVLVSKPDGTPIRQVRTDADGRAWFLLEDGDYVASIRKAGKVFSKNNVKFTVTPPSAGKENRFFVLASPFTATFDPTPLFDVSATSLMTVDLADQHGKPIVGARLFVMDPMLPDKKTGLGGKTVGLFGEPIELLTDGNGHAEVRLIRGRRAVVAIEGTTIRRTITVPNTTTFALMDLVTADDDPFDVQIPNVQAAERRS